MECNIKYVGKLRNGTPQYYCSTHKSFASDKKGNRLEECLCSNKEQYNNKLNLKETKIKEIKIIYHNILKNTTPKIYINDKEFDGVLEYDNCVLSYKDLGGIMLSKLNNIPLEVVKCSHCNHYHSDNGKFAYTMHRTHLCLYCGHLFRVKEKNIGNEFSIIYDIPEIKLEDKKIIIDDICTIEYDLFSGNLLVNNKNINKISINEKEINITDFLNEILKDEF